MNKITEASLASLENKYIVVESDIFDGLYYAVDKNGKGMHILDSKKNKELVINAEGVEGFSRELLEVWKQFGKGVGK